MRDWDKEEAVYLWSVAEAGVKCREATEKTLLPKNEVGTNPTTASVRHKSAQMALERFYEEKKLSNSL